MGRQRTGSGQAELNNNIAWMKGRTGIAFIIFYVILILGLRFMTVVLGFTTENGWTVTMCLHTVVTFHLFHWIKGTPSHFDQGKWNKYTWWEQMYSSPAFDTSRKALTVIPIVFYLVTLHYTYYNFLLSFVNLVAFGFCLIPKQPALHKMRIFGINSD